MDIKDEDTIKRIEYEEEVKSMEPTPQNVCGTGSANPTATITISTVATLLIATGTPGLQQGNIYSLGLIIIGVGIYFFKAYLMKKCII